jgi:protein tyrosine/serine phosphatase
VTYRSIAPRVERARPRTLPALLALLAVSAAGASIQAPSPHDVPRFYQLNQSVFRGGQPTPEGFRELAALGVKTVIDLRQPGPRSIEEERTVTAQGMRYINIPMRGMERPADASVEEALAILNDPGVGPVFVHCRRGADRTGLVIACYRIQHDHWTNDRALSEARRIGMSWFQIPLERYIRHYSPQALERKPIQAGTPSPLLGPTPAPPPAVVPAAP